MHCIAYRWDSSVGIAWMARVQFPARTRFFSSPQCLDCLWGPPNLLFNRYWEGGGKLQGVKRLEHEVDHLPPYSAKVKNSEVPILEELII